MPIYEYECQACHHKKEALQKMSDAPLVDCPECGKPELIKLISAVAFRLKGSGWYETDFKSGNKKNIAGDIKEKSSSDSKKPSSDTKKSSPETKKSSAGSK